MQKRTLKGEPTNLSDGSSGGTEGEAPIVLGRTRTSSAYGPPPVTAMPAFSRATQLAGAQLPTGRKAGKGVRRDEPDTLHHPSAGRTTGEHKSGAREQQIRSGSNPFSRHASALESAPGRSPMAAFMVSLDRLEEMAQEQVRSALGVIHLRVPDPAKAAANTLTLAPSDWVTNQLISLELQSVTFNGFPRPPLGAGTLTISLSYSGNQFLIPSGRILFPVVALRVDLAFATSSVVKDLGTADENKRYEALEFNWDPSVFPRTAVTHPLLPAGLSPGVQMQVDAAVGQAVSESARELAEALSSIYSARAVLDQTKEIANYAALRFSATGGGIMYTVAFGDDEGSSETNSFFSEPGDGPASPVDLVQVMADRDGPSMPPYAHLEARVLPRGMTYLIPTLLLRILKEKVPSQIYFNKGTTGSARIEDDGRVRIRQQFKVEVPGVNDPKGTVTVFGRFTLDAFNRPALVVDGDPDVHFSDADELKLRVVSIAAAVVDFATVGIGRRVVSIVANLFTDFDIDKPLRYAWDVALHGLEAVADEQVPEGEYEVSRGISSPVSGLMIGLIDVATDQRAGLITRAALVRTAEVRATRREDPRFPPLKWNSSSSAYGDGIARPLAVATGSGQALLRQEFIDGEPSVLVREETGEYVLFRLQRQFRLTRPQIYSINSRWLDGQHEAGRMDRLDWPLSLAIDELRPENYNAQTAFLTYFLRRERSDGRGEWVVLTPFACVPGAWRFVDSVIRDNIVRPWDRDMSYHALEASARRYAEEEFVRTYPSRGRDEEEWKKELDAFVQAAVEAFDEQWKEVERPKLAPILQDYQWNYLPTGFDLRPWPFYDEETDAVPALEKPTWPFYIKGRLVDIRREDLRRRTFIAFAPPPDIEARADVVLVADLDDWVREERWELSGSIGRPKKPPKGLSSSKHDARIVRRIIVDRAQSVLFRVRVECTGLLLPLRASAELQFRAKGEYVEHFNIDLPISTTDFPIVRTRDDGGSEARQVQVMFRNVFLRAELTSEMNPVLLEGGLMIFEGEVADFRGVVLQPTARLSYSTTVAVSTDTTRDHIVDRQKRNVRKGEGRAAKVPARPKVPPRPQPNPRGSEEPTADAPSPAAQDTNPRASIKKPRAILKPKLHSNTRMTGKRPKV